jgi:hypothetical protein
MAMPSVTRSSSHRGEGLPHRHSHRSQPLANMRPPTNLSFANANHRKRRAEPSLDDFHQISLKKPRYKSTFAIEIPSKASLQARNAREIADAKIQAPAKSATAGPNQPKPAPVPPTANTTVPATDSSQPSTKHKEKVANGLKNELHGLQANLADTKDQGRKLRSQEATRFKSELSIYFPDYDEVIGNDPKEQCKAPRSFHVSRTTGCS